MIGVDNALRPRRPLGGTLPRLTRSEAIVENHFTKEGLLMDPDAMIYATPLARVHVASQKEEIAEARKKRDVGCSDNHKFQGEKYLKLCGPRAMMPLVTAKLAEFSPR